MMINYGFIEVAPNTWLHPSIIRGVIPYTGGETIIITTHGTLRVQEDSHSVGVKLGLVPPVPDHIDVKSHR